MQTDEIMDALHKACESINSADTHFLVACDRADVLRTRAASEGHKHLSAAHKVLADLRAKVKGEKEKKTDRIAQGRLGTTYPRSL